MKNLKNYTTSIDEVLRDDNGDPIWEPILDAKGREQVTPNGAIISRTSKKLLSVADVFKMLIEKPPEGGFSLAAMRTRLPMVDACESAGEEIAFSAAQLVELQGIWTAGLESGWMTMSKDLLVIDDELKEAVNESNAEKKGPKAATA